MGAGACGCVQMCVRLHGCACVRTRVSLCACTFLCVQGVAVCSVQNVFGSGTNPGAPGPLRPAVPPSVRLAPRKERGMWSQVSCPCVLVQLLRSAGWTRAWLSRVPWSSGSCAAGGCVRASGRAGVFSDSARVTLPGGATRSGPESCATARSHKSPVWEKLVSLEGPGVWGEQACLGALRPRHYWERRPAPGGVAAPRPSAQRPGHTPAPPPPACQAVPISADA